MQAIASESRSATRKGGRFRNLVVAGEVAAAVLLLCGAGLLLRTLLVLGNYDPGYRADGDSVLTLDFSLPPPKAELAIPRSQSLMRFYDDTTRRSVHSLACRRSDGQPHCRMATASSRRSDSRSSAIRRSRGTTVRSLISKRRRPGYFTTLDLPIVTGRSFHRA